MLEERIVEFGVTEGGISLAGAAIVVDLLDHKGVHIAAEILSADFARVIGKHNNPLKIVDGEAVDLGQSGGTLILVGCIESSPLLQRLEAEGSVNFDVIRGGWESFVTFTLDNPLGSDCGKAFIIAGSDKRGAIFGIYTLSEQIGVSPFYWWADVPTLRRSHIYALPKFTKHGEPSIQYRGIFLNDEAPALTGWVLEKFGSYNSEFYVKVFELLLRLKANFLWPAMWPGYPNPGANFFIDDVLNQRTAHEYGIVMSTSHHEPMQRLSNEWFQENADGTWDWGSNKERIKGFFYEGAARAKGYESYFTMGMRGEYDKPIGGEDPASVVSEVVGAQRKIIKEVYGGESEVPQLFALYRDVEAIYDTGRLTIPDDITLLFQDDNHGTIRRLPSDKEKKRSGGAGIYYHFEYVGLPRSYKWTNSVALGKAWHQLQYAYSQNVRKIWLFNVGDLKPLETPITWAMTLAWDINSITSNSLRSFMNALATRDFGPKLCQEIGGIYHGYSRLVSMRKHELIEPETFSLLHYEEAESVIERWSKLMLDAQSTYLAVSEEQRAAAYQLILHPVKSSYVYIAMRVMQSRNAMYGRQRRNATNRIAQEVLRLFDCDFDIQEEYHALLGGKWNHMMCQAHMGYGETWHAPSRDMITGLSYVQTRQNSNMIVGQMGVSVEGHEGVRPGRINEESERTHPSRRDLIPGLTLPGLSRYGPKRRWFDIFTRGTPAIHWKATVPYSWVILSAYSGLLVPNQADERIFVTIDWDNVPDHFNEEVTIDIRSGIGDFEQIHLPLTGNHLPGSFSDGFVESFGLVSMPAMSCLPKPLYTALPDNGRTEDGSVCLDIHSLSQDVAGSLAYSFYNFSACDEVFVVLYFTTTLETTTDGAPAYELQMDNGDRTRYSLVRTTNESIAYGLANGLCHTEGWTSAASDLVWQRRHAVQPLGAGSHDLGVRLLHKNMCLEKVVIDLGGLRESYLGPPASYRMQKLAQH